jgi:predicted phage terminase large subunit-like protein
MLDVEGNVILHPPYPVMDFVIGSVDPAYTEKKENDYSAMVVLGVYRDNRPRLVKPDSSMFGKKTSSLDIDPGFSQPRVMLMDAWQERMTFHGVVPERYPGEPESKYTKRPGWGLVERVAYACKRWGVTHLVIEGKASGLTLAQEMRRLYANDTWSVQIFNPKGDKIARAYTVQHLFENGIISAPDKDWATLCIEECGKFPRGSHDDRPDALFQGLIHLRNTGWALRTDEYEDEQELQKWCGKNNEPLYDV